MRISQVMEETPSVTAQENMATRLADKVRNIWLENQNAGVRAWEENFYEDPDGVSFLRSESFPCLQGIDYIFKWWNTDREDELGGQLEVLWKVNRDGGMKFYKTALGFTDRDFVLAMIHTESDKRESFRADFRKAFALWQKLYIAKLYGS